MIKCTECGFGYCPDVKKDLKEHELKHTKFIEAKSTLGFMYHHDEREKLKGELYDITYSATTSLDEKILANEKLIRVYFSRSFEASNFSDKHINLATYTAMLLHQEHWMQRFTPEIHSILVARYGTQPGIENGKSYYLVK